MSPLLFISSLFLAAYGLNYDVFFGYKPEDTACSGDVISFVATVAAAGCKDIACTCSASGCSKTECAVDRPGSPPGGQVLSTYPFAEGGCSGDPSGSIGFKTGLCFLCSTGESCKTKILECDGGLVTKNFQTQDCSGDSTSDGKVAPGCTFDETNKVYGYTSCPATCFHKDSIINYEGQQLSLTQLSAHPECAIPHRVMTDGVKIQTTCPGSLRLTHRHLVMTSDGFKEAGSLKKGDLLFSSVNAEEPTCEILSIQTEKNQEYFGLNCYNSNVLADGYWVSTFGIHHGVPAAWMKYAGAIVGIHHASAIGDSFVNMLSSWGISF